MENNGFVITEFLSASKPINHSGAKFQMKERESSALVFPVYGKLEFAWGTKAVVADSGQPILIYEGMTYTNTCFEDAQSFMFNIKLQNNKEGIIRLQPMDKERLKWIYDEITVLNVNPSAKKQSKIFEKLYQLLGECLPVEEGDYTSLLSRILETVEKSYHKSSFTLDDLAKSCSISKSYLHKLFIKEFGITPFQYITRTRMKQAKLLLLEMLSVGDVAYMVGYSDIYQFSRAFKRFYNISPTKMRTPNINKDY